MTQQVIQVRRNHVQLLDVGFYVYCFFVERMVGEKKQQANVHIHNN